MGPSWFLLPWIKLVSFYLIFGHVVQLWMITLNYNHCHFHMPVIHRNCSSNENCYIQFHLILIKMIGIIIYQIKDAKMRYTNPEHTFLFFSRTIVFNILCDMINTFDPYIILSSIITSINTCIILGRSITSCRSIPIVMTVSISIGIVMIRARCISWNK